MAALPQSLSESLQKVLMRAAFAAMMAPLAWDDPVMMPAGGGPHVRRPEGPGLQPQPGNPCASAAFSVNQQRR
jgi:hypothetical protein